MTARISAEPWTRERILAYGVRMPGVTACEVLYGTGPTRSYEMLAAGDVEFPVIRRGRRYWVATAAVLARLGLGDAHRPTAQPA